MKPVDLGAFVGLGYKGPFSIQGVSKTFSKCQRLKIHCPRSNSVLSCRYAPFQNVLSQPKVAENATFWEWAGQQLSTHIPLGLLCSFSGK